jgi:hypothetical protein
MIVLTIDWQELLGWILVGGSVLGGALWGFLKITAGRTSAWSKLTPAPIDSKTTNARSADAPPPQGAVEWVADLCDAMGDASADSKLAVIMIGATRDEARAARIAELEEAP